MFYNYIFSDRVIYFLIRLAFKLMVENHVYHDGEE